MDWDRKHLPLKVHFRLNSQGVVVLGCLLTYSKYHWHYWHKLTTASDDAGVAAVH